MSIIYCDVILYPLGPTSLAPLSRVWPLPSYERFTFPSSCRNTLGNFRSKALGSFIMWQESEDMDINYVMQYMYGMLRDHTFNVLRKFINLDHGIHGNGISPVFSSLYSLIVLPLVAATIKQTTLFFLTEWQHIFLTSFSEINKSICFYRNLSAPYLMVSNIK